MYTWSETHCVASNAFTGIHTNWLLLMGPESLIVHHIEVDKSEPSYDRNTYWIPSPKLFTMATRNGYFKFRTSSR